MDFVLSGALTLRRREAPSRTAAGVQYHPVVDRFPITPPLDPATMMLLLAVFIACAFLTLRRPAYGAAALAFFPPFTFDHVLPGTTVAFPKVALLGVIAALIARPGALRKAMPQRPMLLAFAALWIAIALSGLEATYRTDVLRELLKWIEYALFFTCTYAAFALDPDTRVVSRAYVASIALVCATALSELVTGASSGMWIGSTAIPRIAGVLGGPNQLGGYLEVATAVLFALYIDRPRRTTAAILIVAAGTLVLTFSRAAVIGLIVVTIVMLIVKRRAAFGALAVAFGGIAAGALAVGALVVGLRGVSPALAIFRASDTSGNGVGGLGSRSQLWHAAWFFFRHHPLLGIGVNNYELRLSDAGVYGVRTHANSWYLQALAEGGIVLFAATLGFIATALVQLRSVLSRSPWTLAAFAATIALAIHQIADYLVFYPKVAEPWIVLLALGMAAPRSEPACD